MIDEEEDGDEELDRAALPVFFFVLVIFDVHVLASRLTALDIGSFDSLFMRCNSVVKKKIFTMPSEELSWFVSGRRIWTSFDKKSIVLSREDMLRSVNSICGRDFGLKISTIFLYLQIILE